MSVFLIEKFNRVERYASHIILPAGATHTNIPQGSWNGKDGCARFTPHTNVWGSDHGLSGIGFPGTQKVFIRWCARFGAGMNYQPNFKHIIVGRVWDGTDQSSIRAIHFLHAYGQPVNGQNQMDYFISNNIDTSPPTTPYFKIWNAANPAQDQVNKWICFEVELNNTTNQQNLWVTTQDGLFRDSLLASMPLNETTQPWGGVGTLGMYGEGLAVQDSTHFFDIADCVIADRKIGPPAFFAQKLTLRTVAERSWPAGTRQITAASVPRGISSLIFKLSDPGTWPANATIDASIDMSMDNGATWIPKVAGFTANGGQYIDDSTGLPVTERKITVPLPYTTTAASQLRGTFTNTATLTTGLTVEGA